MKKVFFLFFSLLSACGFAQGKLDFADITKNVQDSTSSYFYEKLTYQFIYRPTSLDSAEAKHLYYGQFKGKKHNTSLRSSAFLRLVKENKCVEAIPEGENILKTDPVNMEVLGLMVRCYSEVDEDNSMLPLRGLQFRTLVEAVLSNAEDTGTHKLYTVMAVVDEYIIAGIQNIDLMTYRRNSEQSQHGVTDHWKKGRKKISFQVIYPKD